MYFNQNLIVLEAIKRLKSLKGAKTCIVVVMLMIYMISSYQLGSGEAQILSRRSINDGRWHKITAVRYDCLLYSVISSVNFFPVHVQCLVLSCVRLLMFLFSCRTGKDGYIQIDGGSLLHGQSKGRSLMVNTKGSIYLGEWIVWSYKSQVIRQL